MENLLFEYNCSGSISPIQRQKDDYGVPDMSVAYKILLSFPRLRKNPNECEKMLELLKNCMNIAKNNSLYLAIAAESPNENGKISVTFKGKIIMAASEMAFLISHAKNTVITASRHGTVYMDISLPIDIVEQI